MILTKNQNTFKLWLFATIYTKKKLTQNDFNNSLKVKKWKIWKKTQNIVKSSFRFLQTEENYNKNKIAADNVWMKLKLLLGMYRIIVIIVTC